MKETKKIEGRIFYELVKATVKNNFELFQIPLNLSNPDRETEFFIS